MRTMTALRPAARGPAPIHKAQSTASKLADLIAPRDLAGKGNWSRQDKIPASAWLGAAAFIAGWVLFMHLASATGY